MLPKLRKLGLSVDQWNRDKRSPRDALRVLDLSLLPGTNLEFTDFDKGDLNGVDFTADLLNYSSFREAKLGYARFCESRLGGTNFHGADLRGADFSYSFCDGTGAQSGGGVDASTSEADFTTALLDRSTFFHSAVTGVSFVGTSLLNTRFIACRLERTNFAQAILGATVFAGVDLSGTEGLDDVVHKRPSSLDLETLILSRNLPLKFLHGCGVPEQFITYAKSLAGSGIELQLLHKLLDKEPGLRGPTPCRPSKQGRSLLVRHRTTFGAGERFMSR